MSVAVRGPVKTYTAGEDLAAYRRVKFSAGSGTTVVYADAEDEAIGLTDLKVDSGDHVPVRMLTDTGSFKVVLAAAGAIGDRCYGAADGKVTPATPADAAPAMFQLLEAGTGDGSVVEAIPYKGATRLLHADVADGTTLTNSTVETVLATKTIEPAALKAGDVLEILALVAVPSTNATDTLEVKAYVGTEEVCATGALDVTDADVALIHFFVTLRTVGASATLVGAGHSGIGVLGTATCKPNSKAQASEDLSAAFEVAIKGTWSVANAGNQCNAATFLVKHHSR